MFFFGNHVTQKCYKMAKHQRYSNTKIHRVLDALSLEICMEGEIDNEYIAKFFNTTSINAFELSHIVSKQWLKVTNEIPLKTGF